MSHDCATVHASTDVQTLVDDVLLETGRRCVMVQSYGHLLGLVTSSEFVRPNLLAGVSSRRAR